MIGDDAGTNQHRAKCKHTCRVCRPLLLFRKKNKQTGFRSVPPVKSIHNVEIRIN